MSLAKLDPTSPTLGVANPNVLPYYRFRTLSRIRNTYVVWDYKLNGPVMNAETGFPLVFTNKWEAERVVYVMTSRILTTVSIDPIHSYRLARRLSNRYANACHGAPGLSERPRNIDPDKLLISR